jgi:hypothetical protein
MLSSRLTIYCDLNELLELDSVKGKGDTSPVFMAQNGKELKSILARIRAMPKDEYEQQAAQQRNYAKGLYAPNAFSAALAPTERQISKEPPPLETSP